MSTNLHKFVVIEEPLKHQKYSWRDTDWISRVRPFITIVGSVVTNHALYKKFVGVIKTLHNDR